MLVTPIQDSSAARDEVGLRAIAGAKLNERHQRLLDDASRRNGGDAAWRLRKIAEARDLLALSQVAPPGRLVVQMLDLRGSLRAMLAVQVPVPCRPDENNVLRVSPGAVIGLTYPREVLRECLPGAAFVRVLEPWGVWHANVFPAEQPLCLGLVLPVNIPVVQLVLMTYDALSMKVRQVDEADTAGVFNADAARWWAANLHRAPLAKAWFLEPDAA
jgi:hypothetical protein